MSIKQTWRKVIDLVQRNTRWLHTGTNLWRTLKYVPSVYPLDDGTPKWRPRFKLSPRAFLILSFLISVGALGTSFISPTSDIYWTVTIIGILAPFIVGFAYFRNYFVSARVSGAIARQRLEASYDVFSITSLGDIGTTLLISNAALNPAPRQVLTSPVGSSRRLPLPLWVIALLMYVAIGTILFLSDIEYTAPLYPTVFVAWFVTVVGSIAFFSAMTQEVEFTPATGAVVGMLIPQFVRRTTSAELMSLAVFFVAQISNILLIAVVCFVLLPHIFEKLTFFGWVADLTLFGLRYIVYIVVRAGAIHLLWKALNWRLQVEQSEIDLALRLHNTVRGSNSTTGQRS
jgi:hypothetical protein